MVARDRIELPTRGFSAGGFAWDTVRARVDSRGAAPISALGVMPAPFCDRLRCFQKPNRR
jgi:hypothetical protein